MRVLTTLPQRKLRDAAAAAATAETTGFDGIVTMENKHDPFLSLAAAATVTQRVELTTGIAISFNRSPMVASNIAWDLYESSGGRFALGLGTQIRAHNEKRFSVPWSAPAPRMREYLQALRAIWRCWDQGEKLRYEGEHYTFTLMIPNFMPENTVPGIPRVTLAAVGPRMLTLAGEEADGVQLHPFCTRKYISEMVLPCLEKGFAVNGRRREDFEIMGGGFIATGPDDAAVQQMADWVRYRIAFYGSTPAYYPVLEAHGLEDLGLKLNRMTKDGQWDKIAAEVPDDLLHACAAIGRHDEIAAMIKARFGGVSDTVFASSSSEVQSDLPPDVIQDIQQIPTAFRGGKAAAT
ncbi:MAG: TIGR03617 family F420-dependent LLM class oxidoreductase [Pseudomonadota bacterium]